MAKNESESESDGRFQEFQRKLVNSRFFTISVLLHVILLVTFGGTILFYPRADPPDIPGGHIAIAEPDVPEQPKTSLPTPPTLPSAGPINPISPGNQNKSFEEAIIAQGGGSFVLPQNQGPRLPGMPSGPATGARGSDGVGEPIPQRQITLQQAIAIKGFAHWDVPGSGPQTPLRDRKFEFTAYLAKYGDPNDVNRAGDWASTNWVKEGEIQGGSLSNLLYAISKFSQDKIHASPQPVPLDLSSQEIFAKRPPFIFFTGHRDFVLTDQEVTNLQKYVCLGGCIWGDSSLPGRRSRFDIAFRREMRRVVPDVDKGWEVISANQGPFGRSTYYPEVRETPPGVNFYKEPIYALKYLGEVAVIYTANDYGDMWQLGLTDRREFDFSRNDAGQFVAMNMSLLNRRDTYYRNLDINAVRNSYKFGTNVVMHLLTRWEDRLRTVLTGM